MGKPRAILALIKKEIIQIIRDPSSLITAFLLPLILLFFYGSGISLDMDNIRVAVVMEDHTPLAASLVESLEQSRFLKTTVIRHRQLAEQQLSSGLVHAYVVIPERFSKDLVQRSEEATIQVIADGSDPNTAQFALQYVRGIVANWRSQQRVQELPSAHVRLQARIWYNEEVSSHWFLLPGSIVIILTVTGALLTAMVVAREWERGTMEALMATPVSIFEIIISKFVTYLFLGIGSLLVCLFVAIVIYGVPFRGSFFGLATSSLAYLLFALEMGLLISAATKNQFAACQLVLVTTYLPAFILSGFIFDIDSMPLPLRWITHFVPPRYFVTNLKTIFLVGDVWRLLLPNILVILAFVSLLLIRLIKRSAKRLDI